MNIRSVLSALIVTFALASAPAALAAKHCSKGKPCGNACISKDDVCHKGETSATTSEAAAPAAATGAVVAPSVDATTARKKECKHGKACGNSCISEKATCHANG
ncbi:MAG: hypothetical protein H7301_05040 [Cryobacterium sp.]|nr:hypothetical protein [Oligoflexia bacterium]